MAGVSTDTLRHYERKLLLTSGRSANGYREYPAQALERIRLIQRALSVGFTLDEMARLIRTRETGGAPCREVRALAGSKLHAIEKRIRELTRLRRELRALVAEWDGRLAKTSNGERAWLLEAWAGMASASLERPMARPWRRRSPHHKAGETAAADKHGG
jgi:DNA-binding transcriptional MerR regulator